jgi:hypothetical protein
MKKLVIQPVESKFEMGGEKSKYYFDDKEHRVYFSKDLHENVGSFMDMPYLSKNSEHLDNGTGDCEGNIIITTLG